MAGLNRKSMETKDANDTEMIGEAAEATRAVSASTGVAAATTGVAIMFQVSTEVTGVMRLYLNWRQTLIQRL